MNSAHRSPTRRLAPLCVTVALALVPLAGCSFTGDSDDAEAPAVPTPPARAASLCRALHKELPRTVNGLKRGTIEPASDYTAMWGEPAVRLRCGVPRPRAMDSSTDSVEVNGVAWLPEKQKDGYRFTTVLRRAYVEVTVPGKYAPEINALVDFAQGVKKTVPEGVA
ncbi:MULTISPECIES: DUF3515 domain-containing protein [Streptomyces]|uniref:DUF3515 domain-containing protein n=1 Tax=Streptomyces TaxID=1883 RepID=UPI0008534511|nr:MULTISPECIES: DUF3515 domain-containing protein [Streptomyces]MCC4322147.1 DUF3515 domain-containing protein [Streptomyces malaysiensis]MCD9594886.1 DUF3515 domain-containing protein [Streptomyces sp. 8ZJF_21]MCM3807600.1 DUF3515 domain-containing protein [Streptomyces sp. DR7-3]UHH20414.1 DUF3515 domain-containing protein [Streptomyces sp. HNM0561]WHX18345.1 DUF3515 domain-containing protein [Streptomyces sp. NA07423]